MYALDTSDGSERWRLRTVERELRSSPAVTDDTVYLGSSDDSVYLLDADDGTNQ
ncbi:PQQ-binding-like beta-propeller repeat protein [Haloplanus sp.]|uniref:outer membrane protein assembly factor BamB family protein n=1 Tax=Haloplanus sp. TaxID=1961696 RepID=UPI00261840F0|nr:PQQ-binding-like beta-propeller repeat protein [Haloplanus sp.]